MHSLPPPLEQLVAALGQLPGIGPRSAERLALFLVQSPPSVPSSLAAALLSARDQITPCRTCGALTQHQPCAICSNPRRAQDTVCVVERPVDVLKIEKAGAFSGLYHVLGGKLSPLNGVEPEDLRLAELEQRLATGLIVEVILALPTDVEGDATAAYLAHRLASSRARVTRLAHGLPAGGGLEFADDLTLNRAIAGRQTFS